MKICNRCKVEKPLEEFHVRNKSKGTFQSECKACHHNRYMVHYHNDVGGYKTRMINRKRSHEKEYAIRLKVWNYLLEHPCVICGESNPIVLEFDHQGDKRFNIANGVRFKWETVLNEINKCRVLCANCHRMHTAKQLGWYSYLPDLEKYLRAEV